MHAREGNGQRCDAAPPQTADRCAQQLSCILGYVQASGLLESHGSLQPELYPLLQPDRDQDAQPKENSRLPKRWVVIDDLADMGVPLILFTGGEPLMREDIWELARHAGKKGIKMALSTNGTLITTDIARRIRESGIEYAGISLDGARAETHDRFRNSPGAFERTVAAFASCREAGLRCGVRVTLTKENCGELEALIDLALSLGASRFCLYWLVPTGRGIDSYDRLQLGTGEVTEALTLLYRKAKETDPASMEFLTVDAPQDCIHLLASMEQDGSPDLAEARELLQSLNGGCSAGTRVANIDSHGNVYPCQFARSGEFLVGNIRNQPFSRIWGDTANPVLAPLPGKTGPVRGQVCGVYLSGSLRGRMPGPGACGERGFSGRGSLLFCRARG